MAEFLTPLVFTQADYDKRKKQRKQELFAKQCEELIECNKTYTYLGQVQFKLNISYKRCFKLLNHVLKTTDEIIHLKIPAQLVYIDYKLYESFMKTLWLNKFITIIRYK
jgi:hypothetical protein